jgi:hypothetical protein
MSTRSSLSYDDDHHLYQECFENDNVYLRLDGGDWDASIETASIDWHGGDFNKPRLTVRLNVTLWRKIVEGWLATHWSQHPELDHKQHTFDPDEFSGWLDKLKKQREIAQDAKKEEDKG